MSLIIQYVHFQQPSSAKYLGVINFEYKATIMESLSELQNPLLGKTSRHVVHNDYQGYQCRDPSQPGQDRLIGSYYTEPTGKNKTQQFLDATSLHLAVEAFYRPNFILYKDNVSLHSKDSKSESFETTFTESKDAVLDGAAKENPPAGEQTEKESKIQTVSYEVEDEHGPEYEVRERPSKSVVLRVLKALDLSFTICLRVHSRISSR